MKGVKKRQSQESQTTLAPPPPPVVTAAEVGVVEKNGNGQENPSPCLDSIENPKNQRNVGREAASVASSERRRAVAEGKRPVVEDAAPAEEVEGGEEGDGEAETPKLAEGYYEIEAVRKKRVRKGQAQYLIKWRGWPETANTWEPVDNLVFVSDVIDAFEDSLSSGKKSARRRKRKYGSAPSQTKKKQQSSSSPAASTYSAPAINYRLTEGSITPPVHETTAANGDAAYAGVRTGTEPLSTRPDDTEQTELEQGDLGIGLETADDAEPIQFGRSTRSKRRKSGSVRRFRQETTTSVTGVDQNAAVENGSCGMTGNQGTQTPDIMDNDSGIVSKSNLSKDICAITEIVRPISYSTCISNNSQDVSLTFKAKRSDGKEVTVDNKFLKANNPLLLINYYEQQLRYNSTAE